MKVIRFFVVLLGAFIILRLAACTTGLIPRPQDLDPQGEAAEPSRQAELNPDRPSSVTPGDFPQAEQARQAALAYLLSAYPQDFEGLEDPTRLEWEAANLTPEGLVGSVMVQFQADDWQVTVNYPVVAPELVVYQVSVEHAGSGYQWEGRLNAEFEIASE